MFKNKLGFHKRLKINKVKKELEEIQSNGKESILLIARRLEKELIDQGYDMDIHIGIWHFESGAFQVEVNRKTISEDDK